MTVNITLLAVIGALFGCGVYLLLVRSVVRALLGFVMMSTAINLLFLVAAGDPGDAPIIGKDTTFGSISDPIPQAMVLTAIVIGLCMVAFLLALAHRGWQLSRTDMLRDDEEDERIQRMAIDNDMSDSEYEHEAEDDLGESEHPREPVASGKGGDPDDAQQPESDEDQEERP